MRDLVALGAEVHVVSVSSQSIENAQSFGATSIVRTTAELPPIDGAVVATPATVHAQSIRELLPRQVPIFSQKVLTPDPVEADRLVQEAGGRLFVLHHWRYHPGIEALRDLNDSGELGRLRGLRLERLGWGTNHDEVDPIWVLAPHDLSIVLEITGVLPEPCHAIAETARGQGWGLDAELGGDPWIRIRVSGLEPQNRRLVRAYFDNGLAQLAGGYERHISIIRFPQVAKGAQVEEEQRPISLEMPMLRELRSFLDYLRGGPPPRTSAMQAARMVHIIAALRTKAVLPD